MEKAEVRRIFVLLMTQKHYRHLSREQRYQIEAFIKANQKPAFIAIELGVSRSTIYRELNRNSTQSAMGTPCYKAANADDFARHRAYKRPPVKSVAPITLRYLRWLLKAGWSPQQIAATCKQRAITMLSHESIYTWIYRQRSKGIADFTPMLRWSHRKRRKRSLRKGRRCIIADRVSIAQRPEVVADRTRTGDLETDLVKCTNGYLVTVTDRKTLFNLVAAVPHKEADLVAAALQKLLLPYKGQLFTITSDNGTEFVRHKEVAEALGIDWYFADPYCSHQRGCNENQNGLFREYFPNDFDLSKVTEQQVLEKQHRINRRPRKKNGYIAPIKLFPKPIKLPTSKSVALAC